jgi:hypothetical protein
MCVRRVCFLPYSTCRVWVQPSRRVIRLDCIQLLHDTPDTPLLPPDYIYLSSDISFDGTPRTSRLKEPLRAREKYNQLRKEKSSVHRRRKFVFGAMYDQLFSGYFEVNPMFKDFDLIVTLPSKKVTEVRIRMVAPYDGVEKENLLTSIVELGRTFSGPGNCRGKDVGDMGSMHAIGLKSATSKCFYVTKETTASRVEAASTMMTDWMQDNLRDVLIKIRQKDAEMKVEPSPSLKNAPGSRMMFSVNLANSPHYDNGDTSESVAIWVEEKPGQSENWYFVFPNMSHLGSKGVVVKLLHGLVISWDGREIFHCTSTTKIGDGNKTYGCLWSSTRE